MSNLDKLPDWVQPGVSFKSANVKWHVRGIVDDHAVCRRWFTTKRRWVYDALSPTFFEVREAQGMIVRGKPDNRGI